MVQTGTQSRSSGNLADAVEFLRSGELGAIRCVHAIVYRPRGGIARVDKPTPVPATLDYDLWCGPTPMAPVKRKHLHYEWHWFWSTGNGEIGNNGPHTIDIARWALGQNDLPPRALSIGGRFGADDDAETPNTQIAIFDYRPAPLIAEVRNLRRQGKEIGKFRGAGRGMIVACEGGYLIGEAAGCTVYDRQEKKIKELRRASGSEESQHMANFIAAVRSRKASELTAEAEIGHVSAACCHMANLSHRLGQASSPSAIRERMGGQTELMEAFERCDEYLRANGVDLNSTSAVLGPWVTWDSAQGQFTGQLADSANRLDRGTYRKPFEVPQLT
jgi:predicted dehydrogenase